MRTGSAAIAGLLLLFACRPGEPQGASGPADGAAFDPGTAPSSAPPSSVPPASAPVLDAAPAATRDASPAGTAEAGAPAEASWVACSKEVGPAKAAELAKQCLAVSPATHPPCNALNPCSLITDEIKRACALHPSGARAFCKTYAP